MRLIDADLLRKEMHMSYSDDLGILEKIDKQPTAYDTDDAVERLKKASYERFGNDGMGGELVVNLDDVIEIIKGGGKIYGKVD